jgi:hypothetical protein
MQSVRLGWDEREREEEEKKSLNLFTSDTKVFVVPWYSVSQTGLHRILLEIRQQVME